MAGRIQEFESAVVADCENRRSQEKKRMKNGDCQRKVGCGKRWSVFKHRQHCLSGRRTHWTPPQAISHSAAMMLAAWSALKQRGLCRSMCRSMCLCEPPAIGRHYSMWVSKPLLVSLQVSLLVSLQVLSSLPGLCVCGLCVCDPLDCRRIQQQTISGIVSLSERWSRRRQISTRKRMPAIRSSQFKFSERIDSPASG